MYVPELLTGADIVIDTLGSLSMEGVGRVELSGISSPFRGAQGASPPSAKSGKKGRFALCTLVEATTSSKD